MVVVVVASPVLNATFVLALKDPACLTLLGDSSAFFPPPFYAEAAATAVTTTVTYLPLTPLTANATS